MESENGRRRSEEEDEFGSSANENIPAADATKTDSEEGKPKAPSLGKKIWNALELDIFTILLLMKGGLSPAIALCLLQVDVIAFHFGSIGYLVPIVSILGMAILPRAKFLQGMLTNVVIICIASAMALLVGYCATEARAHTSKITPQTAREYNSSASAVSAIWLIFQVYVLNAARSKWPQLQLPVILYSIFSVVTCTTIPTLPTMTYVIEFVENLLEAFLTGLAIATAVSLLVLPVTVRTVIFKQITGYLSLLQMCLKSHQAYLAHLEDPENIEKAMVVERNADYKISPPLAAVRGSVEAIVGLHGKIQGDLPFAKREIAIGKLGPEALGSIAKHLRSVMLPTVGMSAMNDLLERLAQSHGWSQKHLDEGLGEDEMKTRAAAVKDWADNLKAMHASFNSIITAACQGLEHVAIQLELKKPPRESLSADDDEAKVGIVGPGDAEFAAHLEAKIQEFSSGKREMLQDWGERHGIKLSADFFETRRTVDFPFHEQSGNTDENVHERNQRQVYLLLYMEFLLWSSAKAVLALVKYSDELIANGTMSKSKLILPGWKRLRKWLRTFLNTEEGPTEETRGDLGDINQTAILVDLGSAFSKRKDPEHLPPRNAVERLGNAIRVVPRFFRSNHSSFGFRVAIATMSLAVAAFLKDTHSWFQAHRVLWAIIMIAISMTPSAGQSISSFVLRIIGTVIAMIVSFLCYYIPDKHRAGVIVFVWLVTSVGLWVPIKRPQMAIVGLISIVTNILVLAYTLEVEKLGKEVVAANGQEYLPIYELAPYRLATVCAGLFVAFIFTILPYPITEHSLLRRTVGASLYLLANYYSIVHESIQARIKDAEGDPNDKKSLGAQLTKLRVKVFTKQMLVLTNLRTFAAFQKYEIPIGGRFPRQQYDTLVKSVDSMTRYMSLLSYSSQSLQVGVEADHHLSQWSRDLKALLGSVSHTSHEVTSLLSLLSASVTNGQPLPPYLTAPRPYGLARRLETIDADILSFRHIDEPEYAVFAVFQVASRCIIFELETLLQTVKDLVGELDFSFHVINTGNSSGTALSGLSQDNSAHEQRDAVKRKED
ncbi:uncharacterized protein PV09_05121 [Verruconis gallopava]|uniref:ER transporter 6TM N-terminal domain-containing protein n=1 Tax=Verruconis gallopava TaxID=253628 RepID=A0A0D1YT59_9PEZI|nr:uncharacterized protein PV09_05121 [Verruconis gallopava]KIW03822.1 hypothetical protein PV09_05121 [Verruconis gallopava]